MFIMDETSKAFLEDRMSHLASQAENCLQKIPAKEIPLDEYSEADLLALDTFDTYMKWISAINEEIDCD